MNISVLEECFGYSFKDVSLIEHALVHKSATGCDSLRSNERLEFLGDAVLQLAVSTYLFKTYNKMPEGKMAKLRASLVCQTTLAELATETHLSDFIKLGKGEMISKGNQKPTILSDAFEAVLGAIYMDGGYENAQNTVLKLFLPIIADHVSGLAESDHKTRLQEILQKDGNVKIQYLVVEQSGMPHDMHFEVDVLCNDAVIGSGSGKSKKIAEQDAAKNAIEKLENGKENH